MLTAWTAARNQTLCWRNAYSHKKPQGSCNMDTNFLFSEVGVYASPYLKPNVCFVSAMLGLTSLFVSLRTRTREITEEQTNRMCFGRTLVRDVLHWIQLAEIPN